MYFDQLLFSEMGFVRLALRLIHLAEGGKVVSIEVGRLPFASHGEVEDRESVSPRRIAISLEHHCVRPIMRDHTA